MENEIVTFWCVNGIAVGTLALVGVFGFIAGILFTTHVIIPFVKTNKEESKLSVDTEQHLKELAIERLKKK